MVKFYHIIGFTIPTALGNDPIAGHYMGKTSDLLFKTEPDKTIDLDDGSTEVGSEKLSVSFSCLEKLQNPWPLAELWLVPVCQDYFNENPEILQIDLRDSDYHLESKSGDFEKILFSATLRYPAENAAYKYLAFYFEDFGMVLGKLQGDMNGDEVVVETEGYSTVVMPVEDMLAEGCFAFVGIDVSADPGTVTFGFDNIETYGVFGINWFNPDGN